MKKKIINYLKVNILPYLIYLSMILILKTCKMIIEDDEEYKQVEHLKKVYAVWHGRQFAPIYHHRNKRIFIMISPSRDGEIQARVAKLLGYKTIRGSSDKKPVRSFLKMLRYAKDTKNSFAFAVDGPRGPKYKLKKGVVVFAQKTGYPLITITSDCSKKYILKKSWDNTIIPLPFSTVKIKYGKVFYVKEDDDIDNKTEQIENELNRISSVDKSFV